MDIEISLTYENVYLDQLKSDYIYAAQNLMCEIFDAEKEMSSETQKEINATMDYLINSKKDLIDAIDAYIRLVDESSLEVKNYLGDMLQ